MGQSRERAYIRAWADARHPKTHIIYDCALGPVPEVLIAAWGLRKALRVGRGLRPVVDALVITDGKLIVAEAKIIKWMDGLSKLPIYRGYIDETPELEQYQDRPVEMVFVTPWSFEPISAAARKAGITVDVFITQEAVDYAESMSKYWTKEYRDARAQKLETRQALGLE